MASTDQQINTQSVVRDVAVPAGTVTSCGSDLITGWLGSAQPPDHGERSMTYQQPPFSDSGQPAYLAQPAPKKSTPVWPFVLGGVALVAVLCVVVGVVGFVLLKDEEFIPDQDPVSNPANSADWQVRIKAIDGVVDHGPDTLSRDHADGPVIYPQQPPVGGEHNGVWQTCTGKVYDKPIANEHAVHSLEHGAVWITYLEGLDARSIERLEKRVQGVDYTMLSPVAAQTSPISLQAWGYQLKVDSADDKRIDAFLQAARINATQEPGATCAGGTTQTGTIPR
jgi:hypothetical protein